MTANSRANVTISSDLLDAAREFDLDVSALAEQALVDALRAARIRRWETENADALAKRATWIEANGLPLAAFRHPPC